MSTRIGYLAHGKLFLKAFDGCEQEIASDFAAKLKERLQSVEDRASFRNSGSGAQFMRGGMPGAQMPGVADTFRCEFTSAASGVSNGHVCYALDAQDVRGLFVYDIGAGYERRVYHGPKFLFTGISARRGDLSEEWLVSVAQDNGASVIGLFKPDVGGGVRELTEGDSIDSYPAWMPEGKRFVYQTCGIARHPQTGQWMGLGPASIHMIDLEKGKMEVLLEDDRFDFLCPSPAGEGSLYYLKRPYEPFHRTSPIKTLQDVVLFPFRLARAIFAFLNVFSMFFSNKPLQTAGTPPNHAAPDPKAIFLHGRLVQVDKAMHDATVDDLTSFVPGNWELVRQERDGSSKTVTSGVVAYTVLRDGTVVYSNGRGVFRLKEGDSKPERLSDRKMVISIFEA